MAAAITQMVASLNLEQPTVANLAARIVAAGVVDKVHLAF
jgi:hypothetical protein